MSDYGATPPSYGAMPPGQSPAGGPPPNYLVWSILTTIFCCLPLGVVSIVYAAQVNSKWASGDAAGSMDSSRKARQFALWSAIVGVVANVVAFSLIIAGGLLSSTGS
jgi:hypothetical protein